MNVNEDPEQRVISVRFRLPDHQPEHPPGFEEVFAKAIPLMRELSLVWLADSVARKYIVNGDPFVTRPAYIREKDLDFHPLAGLGMTFSYRETEPDEQIEGDEFVEVEEGANG